jgi:mono/diheme cytochrome c family protein
MDRRLTWWALIAVCGLSRASAAETPAVIDFQHSVRPVLSQYCFDCHADGANKGGIAFDELKTDAAILDHELWLKVLKNVRAGIMPPHKKPQPGPEERKKLEEWVKYEAFGIDPRNVDPGRVTVRRLNRTEYRNTIRDLMGVDYDTDQEFPADDTGYGFDNIADVLTVSPMLLEKYVDAAKTIVSKSVPMTGAMVAETAISGRSFAGSSGSSSGSSSKAPKGSLTLSFYEKAAVSNSFQVEHPGTYEVSLDLSASERAPDEEPDYNKCKLTFKIDGEKLFERDHARDGSKTYHYDFRREWKPGAHDLTFELQPLTQEKQVRSLSLRIESVTVRGPFDEKYFVRPKGYERFFTKDAPKGKAERRAYARELLEGFATKAFRRPVDDETVERLTSLAEAHYSQPAKTFEAGIAHAMEAVLASPRFLFREERAGSKQSGKGQAFVDEYSLASRLSYFLWSSMPDAELCRLAAAGELRKNLTPQVKRMLADWRSDALVQNFVGQWLQARDVESIAIDGRAVLSRDEKKEPDRERVRARFRELREKPEATLTAAEKEELEKMRKEFFKKFGARRDLSGEIRYAMRRESEMYLGYVMHEDRSILELLDSNYTFLNERLARHYGLTNVDISGSELRRVTLPADCPRGGILTMGTVLVVTSNPTRTSPVKRGLFILDNILGNPSPPPPPDIPPLEDSEKEFKDHDPTLREVLATHRSKPLCASCHSRLDPPGLALENFNAMGMWRDKERNQPVDSAGQLITGESFDNIRELKHILATDRHLDFYRTLTEKLLTYALGRGLEYYDVETVDRIVERLEKENGRFSALLMGVIESTPIQKRRESAMFSTNEPGTGSPGRAATGNQHQERAEAQRNP